MRSSSALPASVSHSPVFSRCAATFRANFSRSPSEVNEWKQPLSNAKPKGAPSILSLRKSANMKLHATFAAEAFSFAFSRAMSEVSVPVTSKPCCASHTELSPVPQPISNALQPGIGNRVTTYTRLKSGLPMSQGVRPDLYLSLKRSSRDIPLSSCDHFSPVFCSLTGTIAFSLQTCAHTEQPVHWAGSICTRPFSR